jgi:hypothetical protein
MWCTKRRPVYGYIFNLVIYGVSRVENGLGNIITSMAHAKYRKVRIWPVSRNGYSTGLPPIITSRMLIVTKTLTLNLHIGNQ